MSNKFPDGKYMATVKIGPKGQIVIPKEVRDMFSLEPGDSLLLMADKGQGIAIQPPVFAETFWRELQNVLKNENAPEP